MTARSPTTNTPKSSTSTDAKSSDTTQAMKKAARDLGEEVSKEGASYAEDIAQGATDQIGKAKDSAAREGQNVASALRTAADEMRSGSPQERTLSQIADGIADASEAIKDKDMGQLVGEVSDFARRNPTVFLGAAALLGFAAVRFAKAGTSPFSGADRTGSTSEPRDRLPTGSHATGNQQSITPGSTNVGGQT